MTSHARTDRGRPLEVRDGQSDSLLNRSYALTTSASVIVSNAKRRGRWPSLRRPRRLVDSRCCCFHRAERCACIQSVGTNRDRDLNRDRHFQAVLGLDHCASRHVRGTAIRFLVAARAVDVVALLTVAAAALSFIGPPTARRLPKDH